MKHYTRADWQELQPKIKASNFDDLSFMQFGRLFWWGYFNHKRFSRFLHGIDTGKKALAAYEYAKQF